MNPIYEINKLRHELPLEVLQDIHKRIADWLAGGGACDDPYVWQQLRYAQNIVERMNSNG